MPVHKFKPDRTAIGIQRTTSKKLPRIKLTLTRCKTCPSEVVKHVWDKMIYKIYVQTELVMTATGAASIGARCVDTDSLSTHPISFQFGITLVTQLAYSCFWMNSTGRRKCCALFYSSPVGGAWNSSPMLFKHMFTCCQSMSIKSELRHCSANCIIAKRRLQYGCIELCRAALATAMVVHCCIAKRIVPARVHVAASWQANCKLSVQPLITSHNIS